MDNKKYLEKTLEVKIDRPFGSKHPKHGFIYPVNYGYVPNTISGDGEELDCYVLGVFEPLETFRGKCIAIIHRLDDNDDKLIIVPENKSFSNQEIRALTEFQERFFKSEIIRDSNYLEFNKSIPELSVTNLENSLKFYKTIGFKIEYDRPENKFVFISLGKIQFMLQEISNNDKWNVMELTYPFGNGINFQLEVDNVNEIYKELNNNKKIYLAKAYSYNHKYTSDNMEMKQQILEKNTGILIIRELPDTVTANKTEAEAYSAVWDLMIELEKNLPMAFVFYGQDSLVENNKRYDEIGIFLPNSIFLKHLEKHVAKAEAIIYANK